MKEYEKALRKENEEHDLSDHNEDLLNNLRQFIKKNKLGTVLSERDQVEKAEAFC